MTTDKKTTEQLLAALNVARESQTEATREWNSATSDIADFLSRACDYELVDIEEFKNLTNTANEAALKHNAARTAMDDAEEEYNNSEE